MWEAYHGRTTRPTLIVENIERNLNCQPVTLRKMVNGFSFPLEKTIGSGTPAKGCIKINFSTTVGTAWWVIGLVARNYVGAVIVLLSQRIFCNKLEVAEAIAALIVRFNWQLVGDGIMWKRKGTPKMWSQLLTILCLQIFTGNVYILSKRFKLWEKRLRIAKLVVWKPKSANRAARSLARWALLNDNLVCFILFTNIDICLTWRIIIWFPLYLLAGEINMYINVRICVY